MLERMTFKKIVLTSLLLLIAFLLYSYPKELKKHIDVEFDSQCRNIYLIDENNYVAMTSITSNTESTLEKIKETIDSLTIDSNVKIPDNFTKIIPKNAKLISYDIQDEVAKLNFNKHIWDIDEDDEERLIESIIYSVTEIDSINKIMLFVEGVKVTELPYSHTHLGVYLDRSFGINKIYNLTKISDSKMVTTYYIDKSNEYYIPISYISNDSDDKIDIIIKNLKSNTLSNSNLSSKINKQIELMNYEIFNDTIDMNFNNLLLDSIYDGKLKEEIKYALSYSIHDTLGINYFIFKVNEKQVDDFRLANS